MNTETWIQFVPNYEVSNQGSVRRSSAGRRTFAGRVLSPIKMTIGYFVVKPVIDGKNVVFYIHDIVAASFIGAKPKGSNVNHKDGNKTNNNVSNLEYVTHAENMAHAGKTGLLVRGTSHPIAKLNEESVISLRLDRACGMSYTKLAQKYGIAPMTAHSAVNGKNWRHVK